MAVNLQKGQKISLAKEAGGTLNHVVMGLGWDAVKKKGFFGKPVAVGKWRLRVLAHCLRWMLPPIIRLRLIMVMWWRGTVV